MEGTVLNQKVDVDGVTLVGHANHPSRVPVHASQLLTRNITAFLLNMTEDGRVVPKLEDEIVAATLVVQHGSVRHNPKGHGLMELFALSFTIFILALFVGVELINKVPPTLHTPLMSGTNAISGIVIVGAIISAGSTELSPNVAGVLGFIAVTLASINIVAGFLVTDRMLNMFKRKG